MPLARVQIPGLYVGPSGILDHRHHERSQLQFDPDMAPAINLARLISQVQVEVLAIHIEMALAEADTNWARGCCPNPNLQLVFGGNMGH